MVNIINYNYKYLGDLCNVNNIILLKDYKNEYISRDLVINAKCLTINCENIVNKKFRQLLISGCYCLVCTKNNTKDKIKKSNLEKYGVENPFQNESIKDKIKKSNLEKYGVEYLCQTKDIKDKIKKVI
jgi:hypothetical protein